MKAGSKSGNVLNALMKHPFREESAEADTDGGMVVAFHNEPPKNGQQKATVREHRGFFSLKAALLFQLGNFFWRELPKWSLFSRPCFLPFNPSVAICICHRTFHAIVRFHGKITSKTV